MKRWSRSVWMGVLGILITPNFSWARTTNDPFVQQWSYSTVGVPEAWNYSTGSKDVVVAVIDNGIVTSHPDLAANIWQNSREVAANGLDDDANGFVDDVYGWDFVGKDNNPNPDAQVLRGDQSDLEISHATAVAGIIGAIGNNGRDGAGVSWEVRLMNVRAADNAGNGDTGDLAEAIMYAVNNGADIINLSINSPVADTRLTAAVQAAVAKGVAIFAAGGNLAQSLTHMRSYPVCTDAGDPNQSVVGISAVNEDRRLAAFSSFGRDCIDLTAPGQGINSASWYGVPGYAYGWNGTSFAVPFASGAAALIKAIRPEWQAEDIYRALLTRVSHTCSETDEGYADWYGNGLLRVDRSVRAAAVGPWKSSAQGVYPRMVAVNLWTGTAGRAEEWLLPTTTARVTATSRGTFTMGLLAGANSVVSYRNFPCTRYYAVTKAKDKKNQQVVVYNRNWEEVGSWVVASTKPLLIAFSQSGTSTAQLAVSTGRAGKVVADLYSLTGKKVGTWSVNTPHYGVTALAAVPDKDTVALAAILTQVKNNRLVTASNARTVGVVDLPKATYRLAGGDFNGSGSGVVALAPMTPNPTVKLYSLSAEWQLSYSLVAPSSNWDWSVGDYNDDVRTDFVMYAATGTSTARVYDYGGKLIDEPQFFAENPTGQRWILWP